MTKLSSPDSSSLQNAFNLFAQQSERLEQAYLSLQKELKEQNALLKLIVTHISQGLVYIEHTGVIALFNRAAEEILGIEKQRAIGAPFPTLFSDSFFGFSMRKALEEKKAKELVYLSLPNDKEIECAVTLIPEGQGVILLLKDITERRSLQRSLQQTDRLSELGKMAASLAHEIRNPLGGIEGFAALLAEDLKEKPSLKKMADAIVSGSQTVNRFVSNICHFTRPLTLNFAKNDLLTLLKQSAELFAAGKKKNCIDIQSNCEALPCLVDSDLIKNAFLNLFANSYEAAGGVCVYLKKEAKQALITVSDQGKGIEKKDLDHIFTPFFTTKPDGTGVGLAEVHKTLLAHGGDISVESEIGKGTTFTLILPTDQRRQ